MSCAIWIASLLAPQSVPKNLPPGVNTGYDTKVRMPRSRATLLFGYAFCASVV